MRNSARLEQLGLLPYNPIHASRTTNSQDKNKTKRAYIAIFLGSDAPPNRVTFRSHKRVYASVAPTTTKPKSNRRISQPDASLAPNGFDLYDDNNTMADTTDVIAQPVAGNPRTNEGQQEQRKRGVNMGHGLHRMNRSHRGKLPIVIPEGNIRPLVPLVAAKNHVPVLTHWKEYRRRSAVIDTFLGILRISTFSKAFPHLPAKFNIDTNDDVVKHRCLEMMKFAVRQQRHKLKQQYFDPFPLHLVPKTSPVKSTSNEEWIELEVCQKNKDNRGNVSLHQTTGSRSYPIFVENMTEMENQLAAQPKEGEEPKSAAQVVAGVLEQNNKKSVFLRNVGMQTKRPSNQHAQMEDLSKQLHETEQTRIRDKEEMSKKQAELEAKLQPILGQNRPS
uniref:Uncharacterized protein n=1 Tax=Setaria viridis TaxID=4556 RepID=A0A4U6SZ95_SETVI|nr:hypothetical protein SEVIR_9G293000v2 [Setaria viridis]